MRIIHINASPLLHLFDTAITDFAMWVKVLRDDIPEELHVEIKSQRIGLKFVYQKYFAKASISKKVITSKSLVYLHHLQIAGFDLPVCGFYAEINKVVEWLNGEAKKMNTETTEMNWRFIACLIQSEIKNIFVPPQ